MLPLHVHSPQGGLSGGRFPSDTRFEIKNKNKNENTKTMNDKNITSADVSQWLREQLAKIHEVHDYGHIQISLPALRATEGKHALFSIYCGDGIQSGEHKTIEACLERIQRKCMPDLAQAKRLAAAALLADALAIESKTANETEAGPW
jgi:hypothetical protein